MFYPKLYILLIIFVERSSSEICNEINANISSNEIYADENVQFQTHQYGELKIKFFVILNCQIRFELTISLLF